MAGVVFLYQSGQLRQTLARHLAQRKQSEQKDLFTDGQLSKTDTSPKRLGIFVPTVHQSTLFTLIETFLQWPPLHNVQLNSGPGCFRCREVELYVHKKMDCTLAYSSNVALSCAKFLEVSTTLNCDSSVPHLPTPACK